jgi:hypothetical protein
MGGVVLFVLLLWAACGFAGYKLMESKGQSGGLGLALGLVLGLIGLIICAVYPESDAKKRSLEPQPAWGAGAPTPAAAADGVVSGELERLATQHSQGQLTDEEYTAAKRKILGL